MEELVLSGSGLSIENVKQVARDGRKVRIAEKSMEALRRARKLVFDLVDVNVPIYGFNVGVGWNKDVKVFKEYFEQYNNGLVRSHCISVQPYASEEEVRAVMLARLNTLLVCCSGVSPEIPQIYADMLNAGIHPLLPERGSVGQADIGTLSHIGLAIIGDGNVNYRGSVVNAKEAFEKEGLKPIVLGPKDGLAMVCSNAMSAGQGSVALYELREFLMMSEIVYAMSLEGFNGNTSPLHPGTHAVRPYREQAACAERISKMIRGSYIFERDPGKALQDPLSFRDIAQIHGSAWHSLVYTEDLLGIQLNSSDDNPCLVEAEQNFFSCANYEPLAWVLGFEMLSIALSHISKASCLRTIKLADPDFTKLNRFLSPRNPVHCYGTIQKTFTALDSEIRHLSVPVSVDGLSLAGDIEDRHTNAPYVVQKTRKIIDNLRFIFGIELIHAAQALDFRKDKQWGDMTQKAHKIVRESIPFYDVDRNLTTDIYKAYDLLKSRRLLELL